MGTEGIRMLEFLFGIAGGTALLMYGVDLMGDGLEKISGKVMKAFLSKLTGKLWKAFLAGILLTAMVQSSTAVSLLTLGFVNARIMELSQAIGVIYGANIGTTITAQFMAISFAVNLTEIALPILALGFLLHAFFKNPKVRHIGQAILGVGILFLGLNILNQGVLYMRENPTIVHLFETYADNLFLCILFGIITTALVHSSSATVGIILLLGSAGLLNLTSAIALMLGDNIGTSVTALLASVHGSLNAKRTALGHALHNVIGVLIFLPFLGPFVNLVEWFTLTTQGSANIQLQIANSHTIFNILVALLFLPMHRHFVALLTWLAKEPTPSIAKRTLFIDPLLLQTPSAAIKASFSEIQRALDITRTLFESAMAALDSEDAPLLLASLSEDNDFIHEVQQELSGYMVDLSKTRIGESDSENIPSVIQMMDFAARMASLSMDIANAAEEKRTKHLQFTDAAGKELSVLKERLEGMFDLAKSALEQPSRETLDAITLLEEEVDLDYGRFTEHHVLRLEREECTIAASFLYLDILSFLERIADYLYKSVETRCRTGPS